MTIEKISITQEDFLNAAAKACTEMILEHPVRVLINDDLSEVSARIMANLFIKEDK